MAEIKVKMTGMSCGHCVMRVKKALEGLPGVKSAEVEINSARVAYDESMTDEASIKGAINKVGYTVVE